MDSGDLKGNFLYFKSIAAQLNISGIMGQERTFDTPCLQSKVTLTRRTQTLTFISLQSRCEQTCSYKKTPLKLYGARFKVNRPKTGTMNLHNVHIFATLDFISSVYFAQGCDKDYWPLTSPLNAILKQLKAVSAIHGFTWPCSLITIS